MPPPLRAATILLTCAYTANANAPSWRFSIGDRVECHLGGDKWEPGAIVRMNVEHQGQLAPYLVQLDSGSSVVAPYDDNRFIRREGESSSVSARLLRFRVGNRVEANLGSHWERGTVAKLNYHHDNFGKDVAMPYQVRLDSGDKVWAPHDDDSVIRREGSLVMSDPELRFGVGERVEVLLSGDDQEQRWETGRVVALRYHEERFGEGVTMPYQILLDEDRGDGGRAIFTPRDDDSLVRRAGAARATSAAAAEPATTKKPVRRTSSSPSKLSQGRVGRQASALGSKSSGSKLGKSKLGGGVQKARAHKSARPEPREEALQLWEAATRVP